MLALPSLETVAGKILNLVAGQAIEKAKRTEWYIKIIQAIGLDSSKIPNNFDGLYLYTLVAYGMGKSKESLNLFREGFVKDVFRNSYENNDPDIFIKNIIEFLDSEAGVDTGFPKSELRYEYDSFKSTFEILSSRSKNVHEIQDEIKLNQINEQIAFLLDEIDRLKKDQDNNIFALQKKIETIPSEIKLEKSKSSYEEIQKQVRDIRAELQKTLSELRPQIIKYLAPEDIAEFDNGCIEIYEILNRLESGLIWVTFFGLTSSGKSAISNSLFGDDIAPVGIEHDLTKEPTCYKKSPWTLVDVPGILGEQVKEDMAIKEAKRAHGLVFVVTGEPFGPELKLFEIVHKAVPDIPIIVFVNKWDEMQHRPKEDAEKVRSLVNKTMRKFVKSDEDIVYGNALLFDRGSGKMIRQPLPQLIDRMYANAGIFGEVVQVIDPANRAVNMSADIQKRLFQARTSLARKLIRYFGWASIVGNVMIFDELLVTPGILVTMTYVVSNVLGVKVNADRAFEITIKLLKFCAQDLTATFVGVALASTVLNALPFGYFVDVVGLGALKYSRTVTLGEVLIEYIRTEDKWDDNRHKAILECRERAQNLYGSFKRK